MIVACSLGRLYLHDAVVEYLSRSGQFAPEAGNVAVLDETCGHIERLRDVFPVVLEVSLGNKWLVGSGKQGCNQ